MKRIHLELRARFPNSQIVLVEHQAAHAASAFFASPFEEAIVRVGSRSGSTAFRESAELLAASFDKIAGKTVKRIARTEKKPVRTAEKTVKKNEKIVKRLAMTADVWPVTDGFVAERVIGDWIDFYSTERPHSSLNGKTPGETYRLSPVDMTDKSGDLPTYPQGQQQKDSNQRELAA